MSERVVYAGNCEYCNSRNSLFMAGGVSVCEFCKRVQSKFLETPPPIGIMPRRIWLEMRRDALAAAILRYEDRMDDEHVKKWVLELAHITVQIASERLVD